jgi:hypothetical protein
MASSNEPPWPDGFEDEGPLAGAGVGPGRSGDDRPVPAARQPSGRGTNVSWPLAARQGAIQVRWIAASPCAHEPTSDAPVADEAPSRSPWRTARAVAALAGDPVVVGAARPSAGSGSQGATATLGRPASTAPSGWVASPATAPTARLAVAAASPRARPAVLTTPPTLWVAVPYTPAAVPLAGATAPPTAPVAVVFASSAMPRAPATTPPTTRVAVPVTPLTVRRGLATTSPTARVAAGGADRTTRVAVVTGGGAATLGAGTGLGARTGGGAVTALGTRTGGEEIALAARVER